MGWKWSLTFLLRNLSHLRNSSLSEVKSANYFGFTSNMGNKIHLSYRSMFTVAEGPSQITINILSQQFIHFWCYNQLKTYIIIVGQRRCSIFLENTSMRPRLNKYRNLGFHLNISHYKGRNLNSPATEICYKM